jgi:hypothetical protein
VTNSSGEFEKVSPCRMCYRIINPLPPRARRDASNYLNHCPMKGVAGAAPKYIPFVYWNS